MPSYGGGQFPGGPKGGSGGKIVAIVAAALVVVGLVVGGVVLLTRGDDPDPVATTSGDPKPSTSSARPTTTGPTSGNLDNAAATELAESAFPTAAGHDFDYCFDWVEDYESEASILCQEYTSDVSYSIYFFSDQAAMKAGIVDDWRDFEETPWEHGADFVEDSGGYYYSVVRCYSGAPACIAVFEDTKEEAEAALNQILYLDASGIASLNVKLDELGLTG